METAILLRENRDGSLKGSLRTQSTADMSAVAKHFGGGGHAYAAGLEVADMDAAQLLEKILETIKKETD